jgi:malate permease and related proteins
VSHLASLFANNLLPIFIVAAVGYTLSATHRVEPHTLAQVTFQVFSPCLVFTLITASALHGSDLARMAAFSAVAIAVPAVIAGVLAGVLRLQRRTAAAFVLLAMLSNAGNFGLSAVKLAFGDAALAYAGVYFAVSVALTYTVGVVIASAGTAPLRTAVLGVLRVPTIYAVAIALVVRAVGWPIPTPIDRAIGTLSDGAIPAMLVLLGMQLHRSGLGWTQLLVPSVVLRLVVAPGAALALATLFRLPVPAVQGGVMEAAMPAAVVTTVLAEFYGLDTTFVTRVVVASTVLSPLTLTPLLAWLGAG